MWIEGFQEAFQWHSLLFLILGTFWGLVVGVLPGLGPQFAVTLALPLSFGLPPATAIIMLSAVHASSCYGGSISSIMINTPGTVGSIATCWDGFQMAKKGEAGFALGISTMGSFAGGFMGWLTLVIISPILTEIAMKMGPPEYFMVALLALSLLSIGSQGKTIKGLILGGIGLIVSFIGRSPVTGELRFNLGSLYLEDGIPLVSVALGLFALTQAICLVEAGGSISESYGIKHGVWKGIKEALSYPFTIIRAGLIGIFMGIMPALGISAASLTAYMVEKKVASDHDRNLFGTGTPRGVLAPEVANNACLVGDLIPTITLGIPGSSVTALFLAALMIHGIQPGPDYFARGVLPYTVFVGVLLAQISFLLFGGFFGGQLSKIVLVPTALLAPAITVLCFIGTYSVRQTLLDVWIMMAFGILGYFLDKNGWPLSCLILGLVLGEIVEQNFQRTLLIGFGSYKPFINRPGSLGILLVTLISIFWPLIISLLGRIRLKSENVANKINKTGGDN